MNVAARIGSAAGVRGMVIAKADGELLLDVGASGDAESVAAIAVVLDRHLGGVGRALGLGGLRGAVLTAVTRVRILGKQGEAVALLEVERNRPTGDLEAMLRDEDWSAGLQAIASLAPEEIEVDFAPSEPPSVRIEPATVPRLRSPASPKPAPVVPPPPRAPLPSRPKASVPVSPTSARSVPADANILDDTWDVDDLLSPVPGPDAAFRRALVQGDLRKAEALAEELLGPKPTTTAGTPADHARRIAYEALAALLHGAAAALAGDGRGALAHLRETDPSAVDGSLRWAIQLWTARAELSSGIDLEAARGSAEEALRLAADLDAEAEGWSLYVLAEIAFTRQDHPAALSYLASVRERFTVLQETASLARVWLLEARVLGAAGRNLESRDAAEKAHAQRPSWPPPVLFMAQRELGADRAATAEALVKPLLSVPSRPVEVVRMQKLLEMVRANELTPGEAYEYLGLLEAPPAEAVVDQLGRMAERFPQRPFLTETLGWTLLRAGDYDRAAELFQRLSQATELSSEERSSVLLALGCVATGRARYERTGVKLRAAVLAAPTDLRPSAPAPVRCTPPPPSAAHQLAPIDIGSLERSASADASRSPAHAVSLTMSSSSQRGPVFSGSLSIFCLPDLLEFLRSGQRTGTLVCASEAGIGAIHLRAGRLTGGACPKVVDIGEWLVRRGKLSADDLRQAVVAQSDTSSGKKLLGLTLLERRLVKADVLREALEAQIIDTVRELITWVDGQFAFNPDPTAEATNSDIDVELDPQVVLLNLFKEHDEAQR